MFVEKFSGQFIKIQHRARTEIEPADNLAWASRCGSIPRPIDQYEPADFGSELKRQPERIVFVQVIEPVAPPDIGAPKRLILLP